ncbi:MAG: SGNH/GDSL hydrolase family protein [Candidatus Omnitrophica bacterium]|nr:SGNH/GDSL hydrolase family protein [Candidatus Omnitrophota bacterium]
MAKKLFFRIGAVLFGCIILIAASETFLNVASAIVKQDNIQLNEDLGDETYTIFCIGDSFTFGSGVGREYAYPAQLESMLKTNFPKKDIRVVNLGIPGANSTQILGTLVENVEKYSPRLIIIWAGVDNCWNLTDSNYFLFNNVKNVHSFLKRLDAIFLKLRTYKLLKIAKMNLENKLERKALLKGPYCDNPFVRKKQDQLLAEAKEMIRENRENRKNILDKLVEVYEVDQNTSVIIKLLKGYYPWKQFSEMVLEFSKMIEDESLISEINQKGYIEKSPKKADFSYNIDAERDDQSLFDRWLQYDLEKMIGIASESKAQVILLTYFYEGMERGGDNVVIRKMASRYEIPCVSFSSIFNDLLQKEPFENYFFLDGHCNEKGNRIVAESVLEALLENEIIQSGLIENR